MQFVLYLWEKHHSARQPSYQCSTRQLFSTWRTAIIPVQYQTTILNLENSHHTSAVLDNYSQPGEQPSYQCSTRQLFSTGRTAIIPVQYQTTILNLENSHHTSAVLDNYSQTGEQLSYQCSTRQLFSTWRTAIIPVQYQTTILNLENSHHTQCSHLLDTHFQPGKQRLSWLVTVIAFFQSILI